MKPLENCSIIIPVYNGAGTLPELIQRLGRSMEALGPGFEIVLVNDGSRDHSWQVIEKLSESDARVVGINMQRNYGQHNALLCGVRAAQYPICITMDDDLQHPPEEIHKLLSRLCEGFDVVYGIPQKLPHALWRNLFSRLIKRLLAYVMDIPTLKDIGSFRAFRTELRNAFVDYRNPNVILDVLLSWGTTNFGTVAVEEEQRQAGSSNYNFRRLFKIAMLLLTGYSTAPLQLASQVGFIATLFGLAIFIYVLVLYFTAGSIPGFPFLASIISIFSGLQLFTLGIFGEYLARIFDRSMDRPTYVVKQRTRL